MVISSVLKQAFSETHLEHTVGFFSRMLTKTERSYSVDDLEMYAVFRAAEYFLVYIFYREIPILNDLYGSCKPTATKPTANEQSLKVDTATLRVHLSSRASARKSHCDC